MDRARGAWERDTQYTSMYDNPSEGNPVTGLEPYTEVRKGREVAKAFTPEHQITHH